MAESFLFNIAERVVEKIAHLSVEEARLGFNAQSYLSKPKENTSSIKAVLLDPNINFKVRFLASCSLPLLFSLEMGHKIKQINKRLDELATEWNSSNLGQGNENRHVLDRETHYFVNSLAVIGSDDDKENIVDLLMKPSEDPSIITVISVWGMGGLGKTTLAQLVYNDDRLKIWVCVSGELDLPRLLKLIIQSVDEERKCENLMVEALQTCLQSLLNDEKLLLVLDDVRNKNRGRWIDLKRFIEINGWLVWKQNHCDHSEFEGCVDNELDSPL